VCKKYWIIANYANKLFICFISVTPNFLKIQNSVITSLTRNHISGIEIETVYTGYFLYARDRNSELLNLVNSFFLKYGDKCF